MTPADLERVRGVLTTTLPKHRILTYYTGSDGNLSWIEVRCNCGEEIPLREWADHVAAEIVAVLAAQGEETE